MSGPRRLPSGPLSHIYALEGPGEPVVVKLAASAALACEADALRRVGALGNGPRVLAQGDGVLVLSLVPGAVIPADALVAGNTRALGGLLRAVHEAEVTDWGTWPGWERPAVGLAEYHARLADTVEALAPAALHDRTAAIVRRLPPLPAGEERAFRRLHGDLWSGNVLWHDGRPALLDWEYSRQGDPAEELAYMIEMDALDARAAGGLLDGYGRAELSARVQAWRPLVALGAGLWYAELGIAERAGPLLAQAETAVGLPV